MKRLIEFAVLMIIVAVCVSIVALMFPALQKISMNFEEPAKSWCGIGNPIPDSVEEFGFEVIKETANEQVVVGWYVDNDNQYFSEVFVLKLCEVES